MDVKKLLNASEAAEFLGVHRPKFYQLREFWQLREIMQTGRIKLYKISDLKRIKQQINAK